jgi:hypothetical protein
LLGIFSATLSQDIRCTSRSTPRLCDRNRPHLGNSILQSATCTREIGTLLNLQCTGNLMGHCISQSLNLFKVAMMRNPVINIPSMLAAMDMIPD